MLLALLATVPALALILATGGRAEAHGTPMKPGSRTFLCRQDALTDTGEIKPVNPACRAAQQVSGTTPFYNWFSVLRSDGAGRTRGFVPTVRCAAAATRTSRASISRATTGR